MPYLNCGVDDCIHNYNFFCGLPDIKVDRQKAKAAHETRCSSFEKADGALTNTLRFEQPDPQTDVACSAENCMFNADGLCGAAHITVNCAMTCGDADDTECASFHT